MKDQEILIAITLLKRAPKYLEGYASVCDGEYSDFKFAKEVNDYAKEIKWFLLTIGEGV